MKKKLILFSLSVLILITTMSLFSRNNTPQVPYTVIRSEGNFEIRKYETVLYASVEKSGELTEGGSSGFRDLANYIFGGNEGSHKIAMTAPVNMENTAEGKMRMSFSMPDGYQLSNLPKPLAGNIQIHEEKPRTMAKIRFGGFASNNGIEAKAEELRNWLRRQNMNWKEPLIFMAYNSPWTLVGRRNEVGFEISNP
jgi:hypothetical protein